MIEQGGLGARLRTARRKKGLTLADLSKRTGYSVAALSKMENDRLGLTYDKLTKLAKALSIDIGSLFTDGPQVKAQATGRRAVVRTGLGRNIKTEFYDYLYLAPELRDKLIVPILGKVHARSLEEFGPFVRHEGEEFIYVLRGELIVHTEFYEPEVLMPGEGIYIDSRMGHAYISGTDEGAEFLAICSSSPLDGPDLDYKSL